MNLDRNRIMWRTVLISFSISFVLFTLIINYNNSKITTVLGFTKEKNIDHKVISPLSNLTSSPSPSPAFSPLPTISPTPSPFFSPTPTPTPDPTPVNVSSEQLDNWFSKYANHYSVSEDLLRTIAACESGYNPNATNGVYGGLFQFTTSSWISSRTAMSHDTNPDLRFNPEEAIKTAAFRLSTSGAGAWPNCSK